MATTDPLFRNDVLEQMIPHIFLPRKLPTSASHKLVEDESNLLKLMRDMTMKTSLELRNNKCLRQTVNLLNVWYELQRQEIMDPKQISRAIASLQSGDSFALYIRAQNACLMLSIPDDESHPSQTAIFSSFPASSRSEDVMSTSGDLFATCPTSSIHIPISDLLKSETFGNQLSALGYTHCNIAMPKTQKAGLLNTEIRDVPNPLLISKFITALLTNDQSDVCSHFPKVIKKVRDQVIWEHTSTIPFRRSGLWFSVKVVLQISLVNGLGQHDGIFLYKLIILRVLLHVCQNFRPINADIGMQILAKIAHRLCKIELYLEHNNVSPQHEVAYSQLRETSIDIMETTRKKLEARWNEIVANDSSKDRTILLCGRDFEGNTKHLLHSCKQYLNGSRNSKAWKGSFYHPSCPPRYRPERESSAFPLSHFSACDEENLGFVLCDFEQYVRTQLNNYASVKNCQNIRKLLEKYIQKAKSYYESDPVGGSQMVLTTLKIVQILDKITVTSQPLLRLYKSGVNVDIVKDLLLVKYEDMKLALELESYFTIRNQNSHPSLIDEKTISTSSFSTVYASNDSEMYRLRKEILESAEKKIAEKKVEVQSARSIIEKLREKASCMTHTFRERTDRNGVLIQFHDAQCNKCSLKREAENHCVTIYERPLPAHTYLQNAVVFEFRIPNEIACLRDALYYFRKEICSTSLCRSNKVVGSWTSYSGISEFYQGCQENVELGSTAKLFRNTPYSALHPEGSSDDEFIKPNGFNCCYIAGSECLIWSDKTTVKHHCTFNVEQASKYETLKWTIGNTEHTQNEVLAKQINCPKDLTLSEFVEFGSLRAGHRLQLRNIYRALQQDTLSFHEESVFNIICQSIWQAGPQANTIFICRESHEDLFDSGFSSALLQVLSRVLHQQSNNWMNYYTMLNIVMLSLRILSLAPNDDVKVAAADMILKCRMVGNKWVQKVKKILSKNKAVCKDDVEKFRLLLININICCALTFWVDENNISKIMKSSEDVECWLTAIANIKDNLILSRAGIDKLSPPLRNLLRWVRRAGMNLESHFHNIQQNCANGFISFAAKHMPGLKNGNMELWVSCGGLKKQVYQSKFIGSEGDAVTLHMDIIRGEFLINSCPVQYLPSAITDHRDFQRVFSNAIFEVKQGEFGSLVTDYQGCSYSFLLCESNNLIITETKKNGTKYQLVPHHIFEKDIPVLLINNFSHWWNTTQNFIVFRPKSFTDPEFLNEPSYKINLNSNVLIELSSGKRLVNINSTSYLSVCTVMCRLEHYFHIFVLYNPENETTTVELPRVGLQFEIDKSGHLNSREFPGMRVKEQQKFGTLVGLEQGLLLESIDSSIKSNNILLIPYGQVNIQPHITCTPHVKVKKQQSFSHQRIKIHVLDLGKANFFAYEVDECLRQIRAGESHTGWLFLALLHAVTASPMVDPFTGLTGTESALRLLQSAHCWSCEPVDEAAHDILTELSRLSPNRTYYPHHLKSMETVKWPKELSSLAAHDGYKIIAKKLLEDSERLLFLLKKPEVRKPISYNNELVQKSYWRHHRLYTEQAQTCPEFTSQYKGLPISGVASTFDTNLDDTPINSVRVMAHLGHTWSFALPPASNSSYLKQLLISKNTSLTGVRGKTFCQIVCANVSLNFKESWLDLYQFARSVKAKSYENDWTVLLCYLAFMGISINHLHILHAIAVNPEHFIKHNPPRYIKYVDVCENEFDSNCIQRIFMRHATSLGKYIERTSPEKSYEEYNFSERKRLESEHNSLVTSQVNQLTMLVQEEWPTNSWNSSLCNQSLYTEIHIDSSLTSLNECLTKWYMNRELKLFLDNTESTVFQNLHFSQNVENKILTQTLTNPVVECHLYKWFEVTLCHLLKKTAPDGPKLCDGSDLQAVAENIFTTGRAKIWNIQSIFRPQISTLSDIESFPWEAPDLKDNCVIGKTYMNDNRNSWDVYCQQPKRILNTNVHSPVFIQHAKQACTDYSKYALDMWDKAMKRILDHNQKFSMTALMAARLFPRVIPSTMLPLICNNEIDNQVRNFIGATAVLWTLEQQANRCLKFAKAGDSMNVALKKELATMECENSWSPRDKPEWLLLELEMGLKIRPIQVKVANAMLNPEDGKHSLMQLNMGEGKTAVIIPMVVASLANRRQLCRLTVLKSLFHMNREALRFKLGGLLNRRVYTFPCCRDMKIGSREVYIMLQLYEECVAKSSIVLTLPEHRLSFQLKAYEQSRKGNCQDALPLLEVQEWLKHNARDVLDESDAILHVKYQLVYTVGEQIPVGGESLRWTVAQRLLKLVPARLLQIIEKYGDNAAECAVGHDNLEQFPKCRLLNLKYGKDLCENLVEDILGGKLEVQFPAYTSEERKTFVEFLTSSVINEEVLHKALQIVHAETNTRNRDVLLILRGLLACGVLALVLNKRWRVNYGVHPNGYRFMAVPFRAKDVAAERTEFGHPDMAILSTIMSYYYSGLTDIQLNKCFELLCREQNCEQEYEYWVSKVQSLHPSIKNFRGVNLEDCKQLKSYLQPALLKNMAVIDFWLEKVVFPKEAKQFGWKMLCSPWDLCADDTAHPVTGFSGTNDTKLLLPLNISQKDLPELVGTNGEVLHNLLLPENDNYIALPTNSTNLTILHKLVQENIPLLLDVGALITEYSNIHLALTWLNLLSNSTKNAAIYFDEDDKLVVIDRRIQPCLFELSPYRRRLEDCVIYLDDFHTRGTDLKIPRGTKGCVTLGKGVTKDKLVQGCMRMRMLGEGHTVCFLASKEVNGEIINLTGKPEANIGAKDVLTWAMENSRLVTRDGFLHWVAAGFNYTSKKVAQSLFNASEKTEDDVRKLGERCSDKEVTDLVKMYGIVCNEDLFSNIAYSVLQGQLKQLQNIELVGSSKLLDIQKLCNEVGTKIVQHCETFIPAYKRLSQLLDEEQERELEKEEEEELCVERPPKAEAAESRLDDKVRQLILDGNFDKHNCNNWLAKLPLVFRRSTFWSKVQPDDWGQNIYATKDFVDVVIIENQNDCIDQFLRPPAWLAAFTTDVTILLLLSPFEANELMPLFRSGNAAAVLHMYGARLRRGQDMLLKHPLLRVPPSDTTVDYKDFRSLNANLSIFSGNLYFDDEDEQDDYIKILGFLARPLTQDEQEVVDKGWTSSGFVKPEYRKFLSSNCSKFQKNPEALVRNIVTARYEYFPSHCHVSRIIYELRKPFSEWKDCQEVTWVPWKLEL